MVIDMNETPLKTVAQLRAFLDGTVDIKDGKFSRTNPGIPGSAMLVKRRAMRPM